MVYLSCPCENLLGIPILEQTHWKWGPNIGETDEMWLNSSRSLAQALMLHSLGVTFHFDTLEISLALPSRSQAL